MGDYNDVAFEFGKTARSSKVFTHKKINIMLDEVNFLLWKQQVLLTVRSHRLERLLNGEVLSPPARIVDELGASVVNEDYENFVAQDSALASWLLSTISDSLLPQFVGAETAADVWRTVQKFFANRSTTSVMSLHCKLRSIKKGDDNMRSYLTKVKEVCDALAACGSAISDLEQIATILNGLSVEYQPFVAVITASRDVFSVDSVLADKNKGTEAHHTVLDEYKSCSSGMHAQAHTASSNSGRWIVDSGATHHITPDASNLTTSSDYTGPGKVVVGNGHSLSIARAGSSTMTTNSRVLVLNDLLHVPSVTKNLLSVSKFARDNKVFFEFHAGSCLVKDEVTGAVLLKEQENAGLYQFITNAECLETCHATVVEDFNSSNKKYQLWHKRLGHPAHPVLVQACKQVGVMFTSRNNTVGNSICVACRLGKSHKLPFNQSQTVYTTPFHLIFSDVWGPAHIASNGYRYYVSFVDAYTRHSWIYLLKTKDQVLPTFRLFFSFIQIQFNATVKEVQSDWGGEYRSVSAWLKSLGVVHRLACPHTSEQNGVVERKHRHIIESALVLMAQASILFKFWSYAVCTAVHLINRLPTSILQDRSPYEMLYTKKPDYNYLRVFGCCCFPHLRPYNNHKLSYRSSQCVFLGYSTQHKGYQSMDSDGRMFISRHVIFDEDFFPFAASSSKSGCKCALRRNGMKIPIIGGAQRVCMGKEARDVNPMVNADESGSNSFNNLPEDADESEVQPVTSGNNVADENVFAQQNSRGPDTSSSTRINEGSNSNSRNDRGQCETLPPVTGHHMNSNSINEVEPQNIHEALKDPLWKDAVIVEYEALQRNNTCSLVSLPEGRTAVGCRWLFRVKRNADGSVQKYKARLVAKGFSQVPGQDFQETFSPVVKMSTVNVVLTIAARDGWSLRQVDVNNAFLNGELNEEVLMEQPQGFEKQATDGTRLVCKLQKALYGLRQAPRNWYSKLKNFMVDLGFQSSRADNSLFIKHSGRTSTYVLAYVDDIIVIGGKNEDVEQVVKMLGEKFSLKDLGTLNFFLGIEVKCVDGALFLSQKKYIMELLEKSRMIEATATHTPMVTSVKLSSNNAGSLLENAREYRSLVGSLLYACHTRPDIAYCVNKLAQFMHAPCEQHLVAVKRVLRYLRGTLGLVFFPKTEPFQLVAFADADWGSSVDDRRSISGTCVFLGGSMVQWCSKKQKIVSRSTTEAEYRSLADATSDIVWLEALLTDMKVQVQAASVVWSDNTSTIAMSANPVYHSRTKHVELDIHFVRERVATGQLQVNFVPSEHQVADGLTKALAKESFVKFRQRLGVLSIFEVERRKSRGNIERMECQFEIKSSAEKFFDVYKNKPYLMAKLSNQTVNDVKLLQGNWNSQGSFRLWHIAVADNDAYKSWKSILNVMPMGEGSLVKWTMEFEKQNENIPDPVKYGEFLTAWAKLLDA
ncbi:hypothetical protein F3Y22_tig00112383pilonHSYRG00494 [Hibiscus syriacus]|uniref:Integrase catalytic domain-containing protein n=1 Tax=Hibiscus syriacus TaxID=106335 RepID=A0A6A2XKW2_HIBSY|nr:hypothetical protein F3Y22_tig00112383pilonHSYRG00494 [Hibiscus syriacus]